MSAYISFYIKRENKLFSLVTYSRSSWNLGEFLGNDVPWEKVRAITYKDITNWERTVREDLKYTGESITRLEREIEFLKSSNVPVAELRESFTEISETIDELREINAGRENSLFFFNFLRDALDEAKYGDFGADVSDYLYAGWETDENSPVLEI